ncbi:MAG TPA: hypothetical protein DCP79_00250 [Prevotella sp.]|nr:hypothetical protein [Prevotella sp.]
MKYGLPYKGSKNKLAERIVRLMPKRTHLMDLFCGGCAVSHAAMVMGKYKHIHINDINWMCPTLFIDAINGKYNNESRWISREDFFRLKDTEPYVAVVWSFGNNMRDYLYSREIEPLKKAIHYALFFSDYSLAKELGHDLSFIDPIKDLQKRYMAVKHYFNQFGHFRKQSFEGGKTGRSDCSQWKDKRPSELQHLECVNRVSQLKKKRILRCGEMANLERRNVLACLGELRTDEKVAAMFFGGGIPCQSLPLCWTIKMWPYPRIA